MSFPRYAAYKDSGVEWLGEVPEHWGIIKLKHAAYIISGFAFPSDDFCDTGIPLLRIGDISPNGEVNVDGGKLVPEAYLQTHKQYLVCKGDFVMAMTGATIGKTGIITQDKPAFLNQRVCVFKPHTSLTYNYLWYILNDHRYQEHITLTAFGGAQPNISDTGLLNHSTTLPPISEQTTIAAFLDCETAKIDNLINEQKKLIELLKEKRQAVISTAVTKGLNPHAPMKDSGVEWLGEVPEHWGVLTAKRISKIFVPQRNKPQLNTTADGISWVTMEDMKTSEIITTNLWVTEEEAKIAGSKILPKGAVISSCVGNFGVASINMIDVIINQQLQAFIPSHTINPIFLLHCTRCAKSYFEQVGTAATLIYVNQQGFENMPLAVPPQNEQELIVAFLDQETAKIDALITKAESAIQLLQERRTALISAAVTGKIDVRNWQPN